MPDLQILTHPESNQGGRLDNQDYAAEIDTPLGKLAIVCDGVGGGKGGGLASELAARVVMTQFKEYRGEEIPLEALRAAVEKANRVVFERSRTDADVRGMATTIVALLIAKDGNAYIAHIGDSRFYHLRNGRLLFRTRDHSVVQEMVNRGELKEKDARHHQDSNRITRALGRQENVEIELNYTACKPEDIFLLTTDGIHGEIDQSQLLKIVNQSRTLAEIGKKLVAVCTQNGQVSKQGTHDNMTVIALAALPPGKTTLPGNDPVQKVALIAACLAVAALTGWLLWPSKPVGGPPPPDNKVSSSPVKIYQISEQLIEMIEEDCKELKERARATKDAQELWVKFQDVFKEGSNDRSFEYKSGGKKARYFKVDLNTCSCNPQNLPSSQDVTQAESNYHNLRKTLKLN
jgi:protein phosphatase